MARKSLAPGVPPAYMAKLVATRYPETFLIVPIDSDLTPEHPIVLPPGPGNGGPGNGDGGPVDPDYGIPELPPGWSRVSMGPPPSNLTPPADPALATNYEWMVVYDSKAKTTAWAQVGPHIAPLK